MCPFDFKQFVNSFLGKVVPTSELAHSAMQIANTLPPNNLAAMEEVIRAISKINGDTTIVLKERITTLLYVDYKAHTLHQDLCKFYLYGGKGNKSYLPIILAYWHELSKAYQICLKHHKNNPNTSHYEDMQQVTLRGLHHQLRLIAWNTLRYLQIPSSFWLPAFHLYLYTEEQGFSRQLFQLYPDSTTQVSSEQLLIHAGMLYLSQTDSLLQKEIAALDCLLAYLSQGIPLEKHPPLEATVFSYTIASPLPPQAVGQGSTNTQWNRYWSAHTMHAQLTDLTFDLEQHMMPAILTTLGAQLTQQEWLALCEKAMTHWSMESKKVLRKSKRELYNSYAQVFLGFDTIALQIKVNTLHPQDEGQKSEWKVNDLSENDIKLTFSGRNIDHFAIGQLALIKIESHPPYLVQIRHMVLVGHSTKISMELLGQNPVGVSLFDPNLPAAPVTAIYITRLHSRSGQRWFITPTSLTTVGRQLVLSAQGRSYRIRLKPPKEVYQDCIHADFDTLARSSS